MCVYVLISSQLVWVYVCVYVNPIGAASQSGVQISDEAQWHSPHSSHRQFWKGQQPLSLVLVVYTPTKHTHTPDHTVCTCTHMHWHTQTQVYIHTHTMQCWGDDTNHLWFVDNVCTTLMYACPACKRDVEYQARGAQTHMWKRETNLSIAADQESRWWAYQECKLPMVKMVSLNS